MTTRIDRIRQHLEPHGFLPIEPAKIQGHQWEKFGGWVARSGYGGILFGNEEEALEHALTAFLKDASKTGARIASAPEQFRLDCCDLAEEIAMGRDPNDVFANWWLRVHDLEDPREDPQ